VSPAKARHAADQPWSPFVLVDGLLLIGVVAHWDGLLDVLGGAASRFRTHPAVLLVGLLGVVAAVTLTLNLDTPVRVFVRGGDGADGTGPSIGKEVVTPPGSARDPDRVTPLLC
jgi:hypothetical protein